MTPWLAIIGLGEDGIAGLSGAARGLIASAELVFGGERHLALVPPGSAERIAWERPLARTVERIAAARGRRVVVLATGDPMSYGIGVTLARRFAREEMTILPQLGAFTLAASRLAWPLAECETVTLHGRPLDRLRLHLAPGQRLLVLSEDGTTPGKIAALLAAEGWGSSTVTVLEHLGGPRERILSATAAAWAEAQCADLNTVAVECRADAGARILSRLAGLPDEAFMSDGQLTKREIRAMTLAALAPLPGELLWDIGAGCGSIAIEWLRAGRRTRAIAVERVRERCFIIAGNAARLGVPELHIVEGAAPDAIADLPPPAAVFLGGGIAEPGLLEAVWRAMPGDARLVANVVTLAGEARLLDFVSHYGGGLSRIAVSRAAPIGEPLGWRPMLPVTQLHAVKPGGSR